MDESGRVIVAKTPTTPADQSEGVMDAVAKADIELDRVDFFSHGTTVGVNAVTKPGNTWPTVNRPSPSVVTR